MRKTILISGGSDGLGKEIAKLLGNNHKVMIMSPSSEKVKQAAASLGVEQVVGDVRRFNDCKAAVDKAISTFGSLDCVVACAGRWIQNELEQNKADNIKVAIEVNLLGVIYITKAAIPMMRQQKQGLIIHINSQAGWYAKAERSVYNATKWGLTGFTKSIQPELSRYGIRVSGIYPGKMNTTMFAKVGIEKDMGNALAPEEVARTVEFLLDMKRTVNIPEIGIKHLFD